MTFPKNISFSRILALLAAILLNASLIWFYHDHYWCAQDDGVFAHVAERILDGQVLNRDIEEIHPGYSNFINAGAMALFGRSFVALRYPLVLITLVQSLLVFRLFAVRGLLLAVIASAVPTVLGVLQFLNPNPHWYCLFAVIALISLLVRVPKNVSWRIPAAGFWIGFIYLIRQPTGILAAVAVLTYFFLENSGKEKEKSGLARLLIVVMFFGLGKYLCKSTDLFGFVFFGFWPLAVLLWSWWMVSISNEKSFKITGTLISGAFLSSLPIVIYHLRHGSLSGWFNDTFYRAITAMGQDYIHLLNYQTFAQGGFEILTHPSGFPDILNGFYWSVLPFIGAVNAAAVLYCLSAQKGVQPRNLVLPFVAVFYAVISLHNQIPIYLHFSVALSLLGLLWIVSGYPNRWLSRITAGITIVLCGVGVYYHAAQSVVRGVEGVITGVRVPFVQAGAELPRNGLWADAQTLSIYADVVQLILEETRADEKIFAVPNNAEFYFMTQRRSPFRFSSTDLGILEPEDARRVMDALAKDPPRLVIYAPNDKRNNPLSRLVMEFVKGRYRFVKQISSFEIYRYP